MSLSNQQGSDRRHLLASLVLLAPAALTISALSGCGDSNGTSSMLPSDPKDLPENKAKASLDYSRQEALKRRKKN